jgi:hypothetical protein
MIATLNTWHVGPSSMTEPLHPVVASSQPANLPRRLNPITHSIILTRTSLMKSMTT